MAFLLIGQNVSLLHSLLLFIVISYSNASICEYETLFGITKHFICPQPGDGPDETACCGSDNNRYCCKPIDLSHAVETFSKYIPTIVGIIIAVIAGSLILCVLCCCICPFCLLYKRRNRGRDHGVVTRVDRSAAQPLQMQSNTQAQSYPTQAPVAYPSSQPYGGTQPPYPTQQQPAGYPQPPYPTAQPPYPVSDQPPPYSEKQPPFNPNFQS